MQPLRTRRALGVAAAVAAIVVGAAGSAAVAVGWLSRPAGAAGVYSADAEADGLRVGVAVNNFLVFSQLVDVGIPTASATLDSLGTSQAYASDPYPGSTVLSAGGLVASGGGPTPPPYPLYAASSYPQTPNASVGAGIVSLDAASSPSSSKASGDSGVAGLGPLSAGLVKSTASTTSEASGAVSSVGDSVIEAVDVAGVLTIGKAESRAAVDVAPDGTATVTKSFVLQGVSVAGESISVDDRGITLAGSSTPLPDGSGPAAVLAQAGISLHYLQGYTNGGTVVSPGLRIDVSQNVSGVGEPVISYYLGQATADASSNGVGSTAGGPVSGLSGNSPAPAGATPPSASSGSSGPSALSGSSTAASAGAGSSADSGGAPGSPAMAGAASGPVAGAGTGSDGASPVAGGLPAGASRPAILARTQTSWVGLYGILLLGALSALGGASLIRLLGVKLRWT